ncbi:beta-1,3-glucanase family protein [Kitasatospora sp. NPDC059747]|uniref:beta-1,3-glucanase family protein n=1 Tax=Kitasatospora sp. NPDC059747 TaxID=3346930 RepID=UPI0036529DFC
MITRRTMLGASVAALATPALFALSQRADGTTTPQRLDVDLVNTVPSQPVYAYVLGLDPAQGNSWAFLRSDGSTLYHPPSPSAPGAPLGADCAIALGASGGTPRRISLPYLSSGRIYFSIGRELTFLINPGPGIALPSVSNPTDPNIATAYGFCEFTYGPDQLYANISYVDFAAVPIAFDLTAGDGRQSVSGLPVGGLESAAAALRTQATADGGDWSRLIVPDPAGRTLRILSPNTAISSDPSLFNGYLDDYLAAVWQKYQSTDLVVDTQSGWGTVTGRVRDGVLTFPGAGGFTRPSTAAVFNCSSAPFTTGNDLMGNLSARLAAALNRTTLLDDPHQPDGENPAAFYTAARTNHYARILHATNPDHLGYAFPYDDVHPAGVDFEGKVQSANPTLLSVTVGGTRTPPGPGPSPSPSPQPGGGTSAFGTIRAESYSAQSGTALEPCADTGGGHDVGWIANGDWLAYAGVDFGGSGATRFLARVASGAAPGVSGLVQVRLDSPTAAPVGSFAVANTGGWQAWRTVPADITRTTGTHTVYLTFASGQGADFVNVNWFTFG